MEGRSSRCQVTKIIKTQERSCAQGHMLVVPATWTQRQAEVQGQPGQVITTHPTPKVGNHDLLSEKGQGSRWRSCSPSTVLALVTAPTQTKERTS